MVEDAQVLVDLDPAVGLIGNPEPKMSSAAFTPPAQAAAARNRTRPARTSSSGMRTAWPVRVPAATRGSSVSTWC